MYSLENEGVEKVDWIRDRIQPFVEFQMPSVSRSRVIGYEDITAKNLHDNIQVGYNPSNAIANNYGTHGLDITFNANSASSPYVFLKAIPANNLIAGKTYTLSFYATITTPVDDYLRMGLRYGGFPDTGAIRLRSQERTLITQTFIPTASSGMRLILFKNPGTLPVDIRIEELKIEEGENVSPWIPSVADVGGIDIYQTEYMAEVTEVYEEERWVDFPLGIFIPATPTKSDQNGIVTYEVEAYDGLVILDQDRFTKRTAFQAGTTYESAINSILRGAGIKKINIQFPNKRIANTKEYPAGTSKLEAVNELLTELNMVGIWVDAYGYFVSYPYQTPDSQTPQYTYADDELSIIVEGMEEELDLYSVANSWVVTVTNPDGAPMVATKVNNNVNSPTSVSSRGRTIVDYREVNDMADQASLNAYADRIAFEASQVYGRIKFRTPIMPFHEYYDVLQLEYAPLGISGKFAEMNWTIPLKAGAEMTHEVRKVVTV